MDSRVKKKELLELKTDIKLLLECLDFQKDDVVALKQALITVASILQGSVEAKDVFRDTGGLQQVLTLVTSHSTNEVVETGLYCLGSAVERNVYSQKLLTTANMFTFLHGILSSSARASVRKKQTASFLVLCLVSNNGFGQNLVRQSSCLHDILSLIRTTMPKDVQDLDSDWFEGMEGRSLTLWCTLLSTACACVNNPLNEGNQRICASLLPYLFSVLTNQTDERILRPVLSLIGLTVSGNESNQDRVRKCGGLEIFVKKLDSLKSTAINDSSAKVVTIQLLSTVDACLSDNECNSKRFGELGGIKLVLCLLSDCCLEPDEKIQAVLTLAHALDAHIGNQRYVTECGGVTVLIQQLTETQDEEFSKTIKYLLHMCVSSGKSGVTDIEMDVTDTECLISKMEAMKRHNDVEMLKKINELDSKLKSIQDKHQQLDYNQNDKISSEYSFRFNRVENDRKAVNSEQNLELCGSLTGSQAEDVFYQKCPTPREKSLIEQLVRERSEKKHLEKLNHMLQENMCKTRTSLTSARPETATQMHVVGKHVYSPASELEMPCNKLSELQLRNSSCCSAVHLDSSDVTGNSTGIIEKGFKETDKQKFGFSKGIVSSRNEYLCQNDVRTDSFRLNSESQEIPATVTRSGQRYQMVPVQACESRINNPNCQIDEWNSHLKQTSCIQVDQENSALPTEGLDLSLSNEHVQGKLVQMVNLPVNAGNSSFNYLISDERKTLPFVATPLDLSCCTKNLPTCPVEIKQSVPSSAVIKDNKFNEKCTSDGRQIPVMKPDAKHEGPKIKTTINKHAEIQCGTPFVTYLEKNSKTGMTVDECVVCLNDSSSQTDLRTPSCHTTDPDQLSGSVKSKRIFIEKLENSERQRAVKRTTSLKSCDSDSKAIESLRDPEIAEKETADCKSHNKISQETSRVSKQSTISNGFFVKPIALPPRRKIRMTPLLGSHKISDSTGMSRSINMNNNSKIDEYDSDIQSEFDCNLIKNVKRQKACIKPTSGIKSQNNVRQIDRMLEKQENNVAEKWQVHPSTPLRQSIVPPRPAYSDCGTRRCVFGSPYSIKSQGLRRRSLDDSGIHSPRDILGLSRQGSPVDSNVDGFRSSSDISDEEEGPPNISAAVLRSSKKVNKNSENKCPGCTGVYYSGEEGLELNSRTYNIALETDPNTCSLHRKLRQLERIYIHKLRKSKGLKSKLKRKFQNKLPMTTSDLKTKETIFDFSSESADDISPVSDENFEDFQPPVRTKKRRKRVPYTEEEADNLVKGVRAMGKHWNQILNSYSFHPSRTNVDLMDKYKRMMASSSQATSSKCLSVKSRVHKPFSMCEERRLRRGIMKHGYNWKTILKSFTFSQGRTTEDLRNKWRTLHKKM